MIASRLVGSLLLIAAVAAHGEESAREASHFRPIAVFVDSGAASLAAYQLEITSDCATIVGVEGGEHPAFRSAPHYDPAALRGGRIVIGAFSTAKDLPHGKTRVATVHMLEKKPECTYAVRVMAAASEADDRVDAGASLELLNGGSHD